MARPQPREKLRERVAIPEDLRESLEEAFSMIRRAKRDPDIQLDYGDAIQTGNLVGGKIGSKERPFEFTYSAEGGSRWHLAFHRIEIKDIVEQFETELELYSCQSPDCGQKSTSADFLCNDCDYVEEPLKGNLEFPAAQTALKRLGLGSITQNSTQEEVIAELGPPTQSGGGMTSKFLGYVFPWIKYQRTDCQLRFEFDKEGAIRMVSILDPDWKPGG